MVDQKLKHDDEVSTLLCLWDPTWPTCSTNHNKKRKERDDDDQASTGSTASSSKHGKVEVSPMPLLTLFPPPPPSTGTITNKNIMPNNTQTKTQTQTQKKLPEMIAARLNGFIGWRIEKTLTARDLRAHLHLPANSVTSHVMSYVDDKFKRGVESRVGAEVIVHDCDTGSTHPQSIVRVRHVPGTTSSYVFPGLKWHPGFVKRRKLKEGDQIGLHLIRKWPKPIFLFSVLQRANPHYTSILDLECP